MTKQQAFLRGVVAFERGEPRSNDPRSALVRAPGWEEILKDYDAGWDARKALDQVTSTTAQYNCHITIVPNTPLPTPIPGPGVQLG